MSEKIKETLGAGDAMEAQLIKGTDVGAIEVVSTPHPVTHPPTAFSEGEEVILKDGREGKVVAVLASRQYRISTQDLVTAEESDLTKKK